MQRLILVCMLSVLLKGVGADTISIGDETLTDVVITESANSYYIRIPADGSVRSESKKNVAPDKVDISTDTQERERLLAVWKEKSAAQRSMRDRRKEQSQQAERQAQEADQAARMADETRQAEATRAREVEAAKKQWEKAVAQWRSSSSEERGGRRSEVQARGTSLNKDMVRCQALYQTIGAVQADLNDAAEFRNQLQFDYQALRRQKIYAYDLDIAVRNINREGKAVQELAVEWTREYYGLAARLNTEYPAYQRDLAELQALDAALPADIRARESITMAGPGDLIEGEGGSGTGFVIAEGGAVMTCAHVIKGASKIQLRDNNGGLHQAVTLKADDGNDWAVLIAPTLTAPPLSMGPESTVKTGAPVHLLGYPLSTLIANTSPVAGSGNIAALQGLDNDGRHLQLTAPMNPGNSGGPVLNKHGQWIGVASHAIIRAHTGDQAFVPQGTNFAVKASHIERSIPARVKVTVGEPGETLDLEGIADRCSKSIVLWWRNVRLALSLNPRRLGAQAVFLLPQRRCHFRAKVFRFENPPDFDVGFRAGHWVGTAFNPFDGFFHGVYFPNPEAGNKFIGCGEGTMRHGTAGAGETYAGTRRTGMEPFPGQHEPGVHELLVVIPPCR